jgi:multidrug efflux pump subunit AcrA (membrane-fusion protein)
VPSAVRAQAITEPLDRARATVRSPGFVEEILVADGSYVEAGTPIVRLRNSELESEVAVAEAEFERARTLYRAARVTDAGSAAIAQRRLEIARNALERAQGRVDELEVVSPVAGRILSPRLEERENTWLNRGDAIAVVQDDSELELFVTVGQDAFERIREAKAAGTALVQIRLASDVATVLQGEELEEVRLMPGAKNDLRSAALTYAGGGDIAPDPRDPNKSAGNQFELRLTLPNDAGNGQRRYMPGQRAHVRVRLGEEPIATQAWRGLLQLIQSNNLANTQG